MTLYEIGLEYEKSAAPIRQRLKEIRAELKTATNPDDIFRLKRRINELTPMLTYCNKMAKHCKSYYERGYYTGDEALEPRGKRGLRREHKRRPLEDFKSNNRERTDTAASLCFNPMSIEESNVYKCGPGIRRKQNDYFSHILQSVGQANKMD